MQIKEVISPVSSSPNQGILQLLEILVSTWTTRLFIKLQILYIERPALWTLLLSQPARLQIEKWTNPPRTPLSNDFFEQ